MADLLRSSPARTVPASWQQRALQVHQTDQSLRSTCTKLTSPVDAEERPHFQAVAVLSTRDEEVGSPEAEAD